MTQRLKRWESPRKPGRNAKGRGGAARQRQLKKQHKRFLKQLKRHSDRAQSQATNPQKSIKKDDLRVILFYAFCSTKKA